MVRNIAQNQKQINSAIMFSTIVHVSMVLLIISIGFFCRSCYSFKQAKQSVVRRQTFFWARVNYLLSLQAVVSGGDYQTAAMLPLGSTDCSGSHEPGVALQTVLESQDCEKSSSLGQTAPLDSRMCEEAQKSQDRVPSPRKYAAWKSALAL